MMVAAIGVILSLVMVAGQVCTGHASEVQYPARPVDVVVAAAPGGGTDVVARVTAEYVAKKWGRPITVVNKAGGGAVVGTHFALKQSRPDGYTMFAEYHSASSMMVGGMVNPPARLEDRVFVARTVLDPICFAVKADAPWKTFRELNEWAKSHTSEITFGGAGPSGLSAFVVNEWLTNLGANPSDARIVVTDSGNDTLTKVAGGHIMLSAHTVAESFGLMQAGKVRILAVIADKRSPYVPNVPIVSESGVASLSVRWWTGISAPKGTPDFVIDKWAAVLAEMSKDPAFLAQAEKLHQGVSYLGPREFNDFVYKEADFYGKMATKLGIRK
jgi:tripartite-type tricarboxylate transporter receptor subunit TctC